MSLLVSVGAPTAGNASPVENATAVPSPEITWLNPELAGAPAGPSPRLTSSVVPATRSRTYTPWMILTPSTRLVAPETNATFVPSALTLGLRELPFAGPLGPVLTSAVSPVVRSPLNTLVNGVGRRESAS